MSYQLPFKDRIRISTIYGKKGPWKAGWHTGVDLVSQGNKNIYPIKAGKVILLSKSGAYGNHIQIKDENDLIAVYAHMEKIYVSLGQYVDENTILGVEGHTGNATGNHLHLETQQDYYKYPAKGSSPETSPWMRNPCTILGIENKVGEIVMVEKIEISQWAKEAQQWVINNHISDGTDPQGPATREMVWSMLYRFAQAIKS